MGAPLHRSDQNNYAALAQLSRDLAQIELGLPTQVGDGIVQAFAEHFETDKVSLLIYDPESSTVKESLTFGNEPCDAPWKTLGPVAQYAVSLKQPFFAYDIAKTPGIIPQRPAAYKTDALAILPLIKKGPLRAVLCISNLSTQQVMRLENSAELFEFILSQVSQLTRYFIQKHFEAAELAEHPLPELQTISTFMSKLAKHTDQDGSIEEFCRCVQQFAALDAVSFIYALQRDDTQAVIFLNQPLSKLDTEKQFLDHSAEWRRRTRDSSRLTLADARMLGCKPSSRSSGGSRENSASGRQITLPLILDGELFGLLAILSDSEEWDNHRTNQLVNIFLYFLGMHLKKNALLSQNQDMKTVDSLTGMINEKRFYEMMEREFERSARYQVPLSILFIDVDHFKDVNDTYGFEAGDFILKEISQIIMENVRNTDFCSRYSGERFVAVLPDTHNSNSEVLANRLRRFVENHSFLMPSTNVFAKVTVSIGVSSFLEHSPSSMAQFIEFADTALYFAKRNGRNQVVNYSYVLDLMIGDSGHEG